MDCEKEIYNILKNELKDLFEELRENEITEIYVKTTHIKAKCLWDKEQGAFYLEIFLLKNSEVFRTKVYYTNEGGFCLKECKRLSIEMMFDCLIWKNSYCL